MISAVVSQVLVSWCPVVAEVFLGVAALEPPEAHVLLVTPVAVELSH